MRKWAIVCYFAPESLHEHIDHKTNRNENSALPFLLPVAVQFAFKIKYTPVHCVFAVQRLHTFWQWCENANFRFSCSVRCIGISISFLHMLLHFLCAWKLPCMHTYTHTHIHSPNFFVVFLFIHFLPSPFLFCFAFLIKANKNCGIWTVRQRREKKHPKICRLSNRI